MNHVTNCLLHHSATTEMVQFVDAVVMTLYVMKKVLAMMNQILTSNVQLLNLMQL